MEPTPAGARELRPLGIGEVLDRAVTLCIRFFLPLSLVYLVFAVPQGIVQFFAGRSFAHFIDVLSGAVRAQTATGRPVDPTTLAHQLAGSAPPNGYAMLLWTLVFFVSPLALAALIEMTAAGYLGRPSSFDGAYRLALGRWVPLVGLNLIFVIAIMFAYVAVVIMLVVLALGIGALYVSSHPLGLALGIPLVFVVTVVGLAFALVIALALQVAYFTCVLEGASSVRAFTTSLSRVFGGIGFSRSLLFGAAYLAIAIGLGILAFVGEALLASLLHSEVAATAYDTLLRLLSALFTTAFVCIFYFDLRVREEGYDLELAAQRVLQ